MVVPSGQEVHKGLSVDRLQVVERGDRLGHHGPTTHRGLGDALQQGGRVAERLCRQLNGLVTLPLSGLQRGPGVDRSRVTEARVSLADRRVVTVSGS